jgi:glucose-1-phosphate adenylyltransferase
MCNALGIVSYDDFVNIPGMTDNRPIPAVSFLGRYRLIDFVLSNMTNSEISNIQVYVKSKPRSVIEHVGTGRHYNINSKSGKLRILTGEANVTNEIYHHDISAYIANMQFIEDAHQDYVVVAPSYMVYKANFDEILTSHIESKADITMLYKTVDNADASFARVATLSIEKPHKVVAIETNQGKFKNRHISMSTYVMSKEIFITLVHLANETSSLFTLRDVIRDQLPMMNVVGYPVKGYVACLNSLAEYHRVNLELTNYAVSKTLFDPDWPIHTRTNDSCPTRYTSTADVSASVVANNCLIEGTVIHSVIGRDVEIHKGAVVEDCVIMANTKIHDNVHLKNVVVDKFAKINHQVELIGEPDNIIYVKRKDKI